MSKGILRRWLGGVALTNQQACLRGSVSWRVSRRKVVAHGSPTSWCWFWTQGVGQGPGWCPICLCQPHFGWWLTLQWFKRLKAATINIRIQRILSGSLRRLLASGLRRLWPLGSVGFGSDTLWLETWLASAGRHGVGWDLMDMGYGSTSGKIWCVGRGLA